MYPPLPSSPFSASIFGIHQEVVVLEVSFTIAKPLVRVCTDLGFLKMALSEVRVLPLSLALVDELISARKNLHGGSPGAPRRLEDGSHEGKALNRACVVMLSSSLQAFVGDVFLASSEKAFGRQLNADERKAYKETWSRWGNPSDDNIIALFRRLGVHDVFEGLSWQRQSTGTLKSNFDKINQVRNRIAHGQEITVNGDPYPLRLNDITRWRNIAENFGDRFERHALNKIR